LVQMRNMSAALSQSVGSRVRVVVALH